MRPLRPAMAATTTAPVPRSHGLRCPLRPPSARNFDRTACLPLASGSTDRLRRRHVVIPKSTPLPPAMVMLRASFFYNVSGESFPGDVFDEVCFDHIPYVEFGEYVAFNSEKRGVIEYLKEEKIVDLTSKHPSASYADVVSTKAMILTWLADALQYELWVVTDRSIAHDIYFSDLPWPIGKILHWKKTREVKQLLGLTKLNAPEKEEEIYQKAGGAYDALSMRLGDQAFLFDNSPTDVDALFLGHVLFVLNALPDTSKLQSYLKKHDSLVKVAEQLKAQYMEVDSSSAGVRTM